VFNFRAHVSRKRSPAKAQSLCKKPLKKFSPLAPT
jgi:hypothetical protein